MFTASAHTQGADGNYTVCTPRSCSDFHWISQFSSVPTLLLYVCLFVLLERVRDLWIVVVD